MNEHYTVELIHRTFDTVVFIEALLTSSPKRARETALEMMSVPTDWLVSSCKLTAEKRLTKVKS